MPDVGAENAATVWERARFGRLQLRASNPATSSVLAIQNSGDPMRVRINTMPPGVPEVAGGGTAMGFDREIAAGDQVQLLMDIPRGGGPGGNTWRMAVTLSSVPRPDDDVVIRLDVVNAPGWLPGGTPGDNKVSYEATVGGR
jgi:hypothetical protein